jgi:hypothetical protein
MANGNIYDARKYNWQVREAHDGSVFIRYDNNVIDATNKGRYNTTSIIKVETNNNAEVRFTTQSGSLYYFRVNKCVHPMHLLALTTKFGVAF